MYRIRLCALATAIVAVAGLSGCKATATASPEINIGVDFFGNKPTTTHVDRFEVTPPGGNLCINQNHSIRVGVFPQTTSQWVNILSNNTDMASVVMTGNSDGILRATKTGSVKVTIRHLHTNKTHEVTYNIVNCDGTNPQPPTSGPTGVEITPAGPQPIKVGSHEFYYARVLPSSADQRVNWVKSSGACFDMLPTAGFIAGSGMSEVKITAKSEGTGVLTATSVANPNLVSNQIVITCQPNSSSGSMSITLSPATWNPTVGQSMQFTATLNNAPSGTAFAPYYYCDRNDIVTCIGRDVTLSNDARLGSGSFKAGYVKTFGKGTFKLCVQRKIDDPTVYACRDYTIT